MKCLHVINLASVRELERVGGAQHRSAAVSRQRASRRVCRRSRRLGWVGKTLRLGGVELRVIDRTIRCEATNVDPATAARDMAIPALLQRSWARTDFGVYAAVTSGGEIETGAEASVSS